MAITAPVIRHTDWRYLVRDFHRAHGSMLGLSVKYLSYFLSGPACIAWWIARFKPELLDVPRLKIVLAGVGAIECRDAGKWYSFLPWLLGRAPNSVDLVFVGNELSVDDKRGAKNSIGMSVERLEGVWSSICGHYVRGLGGPKIVNGTLADWLKTNPDTPDLLMLLQPGFESHYESWLKEDELLGLLRKGLPIGAFSYSRMDWMTDVFILQTHGLEPERPESERNPWCHETDVMGVIGTYGQWGWELSVKEIPRLLERNSERWDEYEDVCTMMKDQFEVMRGDQGFEMIGTRRVVRGVNATEEDAIYVLPYRVGILESTLEIGEFDDRGFTAFRPPIKVNRSVMDDWPQAESLARIIWTMRTYETLAKPAIDKHKQTSHGGRELFGDASELSEAMRALIKESTGEDMDPDDFMEQMRLSGGAEGPTHAGWHDLLTSMNWEIHNFKDEPSRFEPAFSAKSRKLNRKMPIICEYYAFFPDDQVDALAMEAMNAIPQIYPDGALLLFKSIPYTESGGKRYSFGGMMYLNSEWKPFALNAKMKGVDDIIEQLERGFTFDSPLATYADPHSALAVPLARMCMGMDPNEAGDVMALKSGRWTTLFPH